MNQQKWWFVPKTIDKTTDLLEDAVNEKPTSTLIKKAAQLSILCRGVYVDTSEDNEGGLRTKKEGTKNDLLIATTFQTGKQPEVQRLHKFLPKQEIGWVGSFFRSVVYSSGDFKNAKITLRPQVYDIDDHKDIIENVSSLSTIAESVSGFFPVISPYMALATTAAKALSSLIHKLDKNEKIIDPKGEPLSLNVTDEYTGFNLLQTGHWIYFNKPQSKGLKITPTMKILKDNENFQDCSYAIYSIMNEQVNEPDWENNQKIATLLSELEGKGRSGEVSIKFLRETMKGYTNYNKLNRILDLEKRKKHAEPIQAKLEELQKDPLTNKDEIKKLKEKLGKTFSDEEKDLLMRLKSDENIKNFLPST